MESGSRHRNLEPTKGRELNMDKIYTGFGPLTTLTDPNEASMVLDMFRDIARSKQAQSFNQMAADKENAAIAAEAKSWLDGGKEWYIAIGGPHYESLDPASKKKLLEYYIKKMSETGLFSNRESAIDNAFRLQPRLKPLGENREQKAIQILKYELERIQSALQQPAQQPTQPAQQPTHQPSRQPAGKKQPKAQETPSSVNTTDASDSQQSTAAAKDKAGGKGATTQQADAGGKPKAATPGQQGGSGVGLLSLVEQGLAVVLDAIKKMPSAPKVSDQVLAQMIVADQPQYWFPNNEVSETGFYGPFVRGQNIFWAEIEYNGQAGQFMYSGRYASVPAAASQAVQQSSAQGT